MHKVPVLKYNIASQRYAKQQDVTVDPLCDGWTARNTGDTIVSVNGINLQPRPAAGLSGESFSAGGNLGELFAGRITIIFQAPAGTQPEVKITQKFYLPDQL